MRYVDCALGRSTGGRVRARATGAIEPTRLTAPAAANEPVGLRLSVPDNADALA